MTAHELHEQINLGIAHNPDVFTDVRFPPLYRCTRATGMGLARYVATILSCLTMYTGENLKPHDSDMTSSLNRTEKSRCFDDTASTFGLWSRLTAEGEVQSATSAVCQQAVTQCKNWAIKTMDLRGNARAIVCLRYMTWMPHNLSR